MDDNRDILYSVFLFGFGIWSFFWGFKRFRRKRLMENIPTSTVRSLAMGLVELCGKAKAIKILKSPLTQTDCVLYLYKVEEYRSSGKSGHWVTIASGNSFDCPFWLEDETGKIMVFPKGAELFLPIDYEYSTGLGRGLSPNLVEFMEVHFIKYRSAFGNLNLRFKECYIKEDALVYILGTAKQTANYLDDHKEKVMQHIAELKNNPQKMQEIDTNKDGQISIQEWDAAVAKLEQEVLEEALDAAQKESPSDVIVAKGDQESIFLISDYSEKQLNQKLSWQSNLGIFGGATLSLLALAYFLYRVKMFCF
jgi:hypothetical protein